MSLSTYRSKVNVMLPVCAVLLLSLVTRTTAQPIYGSAYYPYFSFPPAYWWNWNDNLNSNYNSNFNSNSNYNLNTYPGSSQYRSFSISSQTSPFGRRTAVSTFGTPSSFYPNKNSDYNYNSNNNYNNNYNYNSNNFGTYGGTGGGYSGTPTYGYSSSNGYVPRDNENVQTLIDIQYPQPSFSPLFPTIPSKHGFPGHDQNDYGYGKDEGLDGPSFDDPPSLPLP